jgi:hypothetical protein
MTMASLAGVFVSAAIWLRIANAFVLVMLFSSAIVDAIWALDSDLGFFCSLLVVCRF